jgi:VCBS repeat-containing protein
VTNNNTGTFTFDPGASFQDLAAGASRDITFSYTANDNSGADNAVSSAGTVTITVTGTNDQPLVSSVSLRATEDGIPVISNFSGTDADSSDSLSFAIIGSPSEGSVVNNNDGSFSFDPGSDFQDLAAGDTRDVSFNYTATDNSNAGNSTSLTGTVNITVAGVDEADSTRLPAFTSLDFRSAGDFLPQTTTADAASMTLITNSTNAITGISSFVVTVDTLATIQSYGGFSQIGEQNLAVNTESVADRIFIDGNTSLLVNDAMALEVLRTDGSVGHLANSIDQTLPDTGLDDSVDARLGADVVDSQDGNDPTFFDSYATSRDAGSETASLHLTDNVDLSGVQNLNNVENLHLTNGSLDTSPLNISDVLNIVGDNNFDALLGNGSIGDEVAVSLSDLGPVALVPDITEISTYFALADSANQIELLANSLWVSY